MRLLHSIKIKQTFYICKKIIKDEKMKNTGKKKLIKIRWGVFYFLNNRPP